MVAAKIGGEAAREPSGSVSSQSLYGATASGLSHRETCSGKPGTRRGVARICIRVPVPAFMGAPRAEPVGEAGLLEVSFADEIVAARQPIGFAVGCGRPAWGLRDR
jgi:hypothetical protein